MAFSPIAILACLLSVPVLAGSSLDYSLEPAVLDGGGAGGSSSEYTLIPSIGAGIASASENYELSGGYAGQLIDTNAPVITVTGENPTTVELGAAYTELGATADGGETVTTTGTVDTDTVGTYTVAYNVSDAEGNSATQMTRTVIVTPFGDVVIYPNNSTRLLAQVTIEGEVAEIGDVVAIYVGSELRGKQEVIIS